MPSSREFAILFWLGVLVIWLLGEAKRRSAFAALLRAASSARILAPLTVMGVWVCGEVILAAQLVHWNAELTKGALVWFLTAGTVLFVRFDEAAKVPHYFRERALETLAWSSLIEFYLDLHNFSFIIECLLQPLLAILTVVPILARKKEDRHAKACAEWLLGLTGIAVFSYATIQTVIGWGSLDKRQIAIEFALSAWLTVGALPFILLLTLYAGYESAFARLHVTANSTARRRWRTMLAVLAVLRFRVRDVSEIGGYWLRNAASAPTFRESCGVIKGYRTGRRQAAFNEVKEEDSLSKHAGVAGADPDGRRLDRREFKETTAALRWISTCMMGWYEKEARYKTDMLAILQGDFTRHGLKASHGIELRVSQDGQSWYAWRKTVTGWCFAIGAAGPPPQEWLYDDISPPSGFPGTDQCWGASRLASDRGINW